MISVCMATYNGEKYLKSQLDSILNQLGKADQLIISDDGSKDATISIVKGYRDPRIVLLQDGPFGSPLKNFEHVLGSATGTLIFLADQDDVWEADKLEIMTAALDEADLVLSDCTIVNQDLETREVSFFSLRDAKLGFWHNLRKNAYIGNCMAMRKEVLKTVLPIPHQVHMHDWWIGLICESRFRVKFIEKPLLKYRRHDNNASPTGESGYPWPQKIANRVVLLWFVTLRLLRIA